MKIRIHDFLNLLARWRGEHARVQDQAASANLSHLRVVAPLVAVLNAVHVLIFALQLVRAPVDSNRYRWAVGLLITHLTMGLTMLAVAGLVRHLQRTHQTRWSQALTIGVALTTLVFSVAVASIDQWVTPAITPFLITCMAGGVILYLAPRVAAGMYLAAYILFYVAMGITQHDPEQLLSNRLNGVTACLLGLLLSVLLWRKFTTITLQQSELEKVNAELYARHRELEQLTRQDGLTGLFNRTTFADLSRRELDRGQRQGSATSILLLDLDHFKRINDTWGHPAGDAVLRHIATVISTAVRSSDLVGRLGGEEFTVLLPNTSVQAARDLAEKLRQRIADAPLPWQDVTTITITASIGVGATTAQEKRDFDSLYSLADKALYKAKQLGRNRVA